MYVQDANGATTANTVGHVSWSPDYRGLAAREAGDVTWVRDWPGPRGHEVMVPVPPAANDNGRGPRVVGLMGYGGAGKSEVAKYLASIGFIRTHIKDPLRNMAASLLHDAGYNQEEVDSYLDGELKREVIPALRRSGTEVQQFLGSGFGRDFCHADLWLDMWKAKADAILCTGGSVVQESVRFPNEAAAIRELGGVVLRVERPGVGPLSDHVSEVPPCEPDHTIYNNGSITELRAQVATWLRHAA